MRLLMTSRMNENFFHKICLYESTFDGKVSKKGKQIRKKSQQNLLIENQVTCLE